MCIVSTPPKPTAFDELISVMQVAADTFAPPHDFEQLAVIVLLRQWEGRHSLDDQRQALAQVKPNQWKQLSTPYVFWAVEKKQAHPKSIAVSVDDLWPPDIFLQKGSPAPMVLTRLQELLGRNDAPKLRALARDLSDQEDLLKELVSNPSSAAPFADLVRSIMSSHSSAIRVLVLEWPLSIIKDCAADLAIIHALKEATDDQSHQEALDLITSHDPQVVLKSSTCLQELQHHFRNHGWKTFDKTRHHLLSHQWSEEQVAAIALCPTLFLPLMVSSRMNMSDNQPFLAYWTAHHPKKLRKALQDMSSRLPITSQDVEGQCTVWETMHQLWPASRIERCAPKYWNADHVMETVMNICQSSKVLNEAIQNNWERLAPLVPSSVLGTLAVIKQLCDPNAPAHPSLPVLCPDPIVLTRTPLQWSVMSSKPALNQTAYDMCQELNAACTRANLEHSMQSTVDVHRPKRKM